MATAFDDPETARLAALTALRGWALRRDRLPGDRAGLLAAAWHSGTRNVRELARLADVSRDTVYADLKSRGIEPGDRTGARSQPLRHEPLRHEDVRDLADMASSVLVGSMLSTEPAPLAEAAWQAQIALLRVAELLDPAPPEGFDRVATIEDLAERGDAIRRYAHRLLAAENPGPALAARTEQHQVDVVGEQALVTAARLSLSLPSTEAIHVELAATDHRHGMPGWTTWRSESPHLVGEVDAYAHLEIAAALDAIGETLTAALDEDGLTNP